MYGSIENFWSLLYMTGYLIGGPDEEDGSEMPLYDDGIRKVLKYGIACYKKRCRVGLWREIT